MRGRHRTGALVRRPVVIENVRLGAAVDVLFDRPLARLVGFEVSCGDGVHRFLPFPACEVLPDRLAIESALALLDRELGFYRTGGRAFTDLHGQEVSRAGDRLGGLVDLLVGQEGKVEQLVVTAPGGRVEVEPEAGLVVGNNLLRPAV
jgi:hypothetical protein